MPNPSWQVFRSSPQPAYVGLITANGISRSRCAFASPSTSSLPDWALR